VFTNSVHYFPYKFTKIPSGEMTSPSFACIRTRGAAQAGTGLVARRQRGGEKKGEDISGGWFNRFFLSLHGTCLSARILVYIDIK
jgi:hypothetical protein